MPKTTYISSRGAKVKPIYKMHRGERVPAVQTVVVGSEKKIAELEQLLVSARAETEEWKKRYEGLQATIKVLDETVKNAREETENLRRHVQEEKDARAVQPEDAPTTVPADVIILSIDNISREGDQVTMACCVEVDSMVGDTAVSLPFASLREILKTKVKK